MRGLPCAQILRILECSVSSRSGLEAGDTAGDLGAGQGCQTVGQLGLHGVRLRKCLIAPAPTGGPVEGRSGERRLTERPGPRPPAGPAPAERPGWPDRSARPRPRAPGRPVSMRSRARLWSDQPGQAHGPAVDQGHPPAPAEHARTRASSSTTRRSHHRASSSPPATAKPLTAAMTGFDSCIRVGPMGPSP